MLIYAHEYPLGAMCHLVSRFPKDQIWTKVLVSVILLLDTFITLHVLWVFGFVLLNMDLIYLGHSTFPSLTGLVLSPTHGFFCWKICAVTKSKIIPVPLIAFVGSCSLLIPITARNAMRKRVSSTLSLFAKVIKLIVETGLVTTIAVELGIAMALFYLISKLHPAFANIVE
ncbi:hypothetical protein BDR04DRAFT_678219 [Suillus decipiens]|nr:hypothetical protein BDR04DRAFT_678219 [Suillus decipiens]